MYWRQIDSWESDMYKVRRFGGREKITCIEDRYLGKTPYGVGKKWCVHWWINIFLWVLKREGGVIICLVSNVPLSFIFVIVSLELSMWTTVLMPNIVWSLVWMSIIIELLWVSDFIVLFVHHKNIMRVSLKRLSYIYIFNFY